MLLHNSCMWDERTCNILAYVLNVGYSWVSIRVPLHPNAGYGDGGLIGKKKWRWGMEICRVHKDWSINKV